MRTLSVALAFGASAASQSTWIVDDTPGPGVHFTSLPAAVAAAASGDTLLVGPGSYEPFVVSGKALTIRGAGSASTLIDQPSPVPAADYVAIDAVPAGAVFRLSGVSVRRSHLQRLMLRGSGASTGAIVLDNVASAPATGTADGPGLVVRNVLVHAHRCTVDGGAIAQANLTWSGYTGVVVDTNATFVATECTLRGGDGGSLTPNMGNVASGTGLIVANATCRLSGCTVRAGDIGGIPNLASRGDGLVASGATIVTVAGTAADLIAGATGGVSYGFGGYGINCSAPAVVEVHGAVTITSNLAVMPTIGSTITLGLPPLPRLRFTGTTLGNGALQAAQSITLSLDAGPPGQLFVLLADLYPGAAALPGLSAEPLLVSAGAAIASFGLLDTSGAYTLTAVPATQLPYVVGIATHWQAFAWNPVLGSWRGSNAALLRVEP